MPPALRNKLCGGVLVTKCDDFGFIKIRRPAPLATNIFVHRRNVVSAWDDLRIGAHVRFRVRATNRGRLEAYEVSFQVMEVEFVRS